MEAEFECPCPDEDKVVYDGIMYHGIAICKWCLNDARAVDRIIKSVSEDE